ncbi:MAG: hypothetical protein LBU83_09690 [Bacteroidales bacterium]|jgi:hypothetical protein|nr:hypothetical protein [Bacteroidales bacterium]
MKKIFLLMVVPLVCMATLSAQISQKEADSIVQQRLESETKPYCVYAKEDVQTGFEMITSTGESLELDYPAWVYYVSYAGETVGKYLIVKESSGNLLEMNTKNDVGPGDLTEWRFVLKNILFEEYFISWSHSLSEFSCWKNLNHDWHDPGYVPTGKLSIVNSTEELENYLICTEDYPAIDFSKHTLLLASGCTGSGIYPKISVNHLREFSLNEYLLDIEILLGPASDIDYWAAVLIVEKMGKESVIDLKICHIYEDYDEKYCKIIKMP